MIFSCTCPPPLWCKRTQIYDIQNHCWKYRCSDPKFAKFCENDSNEEEMGAEEETEIEPDSETFDE